MCVFFFVSDDGMRRCFGFGYGHAVGCLDGHVFFLIPFCEICMLLPLRIPSSIGIWIEGIFGFGGVRMLDVENKNGTVKTWIRGGHYCEGLHQICIFSKAPFGGRT
jgi:hypothetical protein